jgi:hypothetical protein
METEKGKSRKREKERKRKKMTNRGQICIKIRKEKNSCRDRKNRKG